MLKTDTLSSARVLELGEVIELGCVRRVLENARGQRKNLL